MVGFTVTAYGPPTPTVSFGPSSRTSSNSSLYPGMTPAGNAHKHHVRLEARPPLRRNQPWNGSADSSAASTHSRTSLSLSTGPLAHVRCTLQTMEAPTWAIHLTQPHARCCMARKCTRSSHARVSTVRRSRTTSSTHPPLAPCSTAVRKPPFLHPRSLSPRPSRPCLYPRPLPLLRLGSSCVRTHCPGLSSLSRLLLEVRPAVHT